ncbi:hypothetical protein [Ralstonia phage RSF1]|uniref:Uncharacterized protein n=1 Tax=Ralstonia phage RSF1 TaxID=1689679 RepID=A0A0K2QRK7_9CAUD|nr:hypothetical protein AVU11_gp204 [Ralstonia phage RSF1]BAS04996.1 hypothetical protein [Ralstonia phage RSF1]
MTPADIIEQMKKLPQDKHILCQVVDEKGQAFQMFFEFNDVPSSWMIQLRVSHPELKDLYNIKRD